MDSMLKSKLSDDPQDIPVVAPDTIRVAPADEAPSDPIRDLMRGGSLEPQIHAESDFPAGAAVPPVDTTFRPTAVNDVLAPRRRSAGRRALRAVTAFLLTACIGGAAVAWNSWRCGSTVDRGMGAAVREGLIAAVGENRTSCATDLAAAEVDAANAPTPQTQIDRCGSRRAERRNATRSAIARDNGARSCQCGQEIEALKASIEQLKASQQQLVAMVSEKASAGNAAQKARATRTAGTAAATGRCACARAKTAAAFTAAASTPASDISAAIAAAPRTLRAAANGAVTADRGRDAGRSRAAIGAAAADAVAVAGIHFA